MATVRLLLWNNSTARKDAEKSFTAPTLLEAVTDAVLAGMSTDNNFSVVEGPKDRLALYWSGRRNQKTTRAEVRALLAKKGTV